MKEIKFRAWDLDKKIMFNACFVGIGKVFSMTKTFKPSKQLENVIVMQYTGLKDKNGKEIYEGDIVKIGTLEGSPLGAIEWDNNLCEYKIPNNKKYIFGEENVTSFHSSAFEVIGNIYKTPELLDKD